MYSCLAFWKSSITVVLETFIFPCEAFDSPDKAKHTYIDFYFFHLELNQDLIYLKNDIKIHTWQCYMLHLRLPAFDRSYKKTYFYIDFYFNLKLNMFGILKERY